VTRRAIVAGDRLRLRRIAVYGYLDHANALSRNARLSAFRGDRRWAWELVRYVEPAQIVSACAWEIHLGWSCRRSSAYTPRRCAAVGQTCSQGIVPGPTPHQSECDEHIVSERHNGAVRTWMQQNGCGCGHCKYVHEGDARQEM
jgi:hypothetical protein